MALTRTIDVQDFMNHHKLSSYQIRIIALCFLIVAIDGFDTAASASSPRLSEPSGVLRRPSWRRCSAPACSA